MANAIAAEQASQRALQRKIDGLLQAQATRGNVPSVFNGSFAWPMSGVITQEFGCTGFAWEPPLGDCAHFHRGIDIANDKYTRRSAQPAMGSSCLPVPTPTIRTRRRGS